MGDILKFRLSNTFHLTSVYLPTDLSWTKFKSTVFGFLNVEYSNSIKSLEVVDVLAGDAVLETWTEDNFALASFDLKVPNRELVFVIHLESDGEVTSPQPASSLSPTKNFTPSYLSSDLVSSVSTHEESNLFESRDSLKSYEYKFASSIMMMNNFDEHFFDKIISYEIRKDESLEIDINNDFLKHCASGDVVAMRSSLNDPLSNSFNFAVEGLKGVFVASSHGQLAIVEDLHEAGVSITAIDGTCKLSPLDVACLKKHENVANWLIANHCNVSRLNVFGATPLHYICGNGLTSLMTYIDKSNVDIISGKGLSLSHYAAGFGSTPLVEHLVKLEADISLWDSFGNCPLHYAAAGGHLETVYLMVEVGRCPVDCFNENGQTPFLIACRTGRFECARWLAASASPSTTRGGGGANAFIEDGQWRNALHAAALSGNIELIEWLASLGISLSSKTKAGQTAIDLTSNAEVIDCLRRLEAKKWVKDQNINVEKRLALDTAAMIDKSKENHESNVETAYQYEGKLSETATDETKNSEPFEEELYKEEEASREEVKHKFRSHDSFLDTDDIGEGYYSHLQAPDKLHPNINRRLYEHRNDESVQEEECSKQSEGRNLTALAHDNKYPTNGTQKMCKLFDCCASGDLDYIKWYASEGHDLFIKNEHGSMLTHLAAKEGHLNILQFLHEAGAELEATNDKGFTPLAAACSYLRPNEYSVVKWLASQGVQVCCADIEKDFSVEPMYHVASTDFDCSELIEFLYQTCSLSKYSIKQFNKGKNIIWSPLHTAATHGVAANIEAFIKVGMKLTPVLAVSSYTPLHSAAISETPSVDAISTILSHCTYDDVVAVDNQGRTAVFLACLVGFSEGAFLIAETKCDSVEIQNFAGNTCLHAAAQTGNERLVKWLLTNYPGTNVLNNAGVDFKHFAVVAGHSNILNISDAEAPDIVFVHDAFRTGNTEKLIEANFSYDLTEEALVIDHSTNVPFIHLMATSGFVDAISFLIQKGMSLNVKDNFGYQPLHCAVKADHVKLVQCMVLEGGVSVYDMCPDDSSCLHLAIQSSSVEMVEALLNLGLDCNSQDGDGDCAIHVAAQTCRFDVICLLQDNGADIHVQNGNMLSVLHLVVLGASDDSEKMNDVGRIIDHFLQSGCKIDVFGKNKLTPFHLACARGNTELCDYLFESGSNIFLTGGKDNLNTAVHIAAASGNLPVIEWCVCHGLRYDTINENNLTPAEVAQNAGHEDAYHWLNTTASTVYNDRFADCLVSELYWAIDLNYSSLAHSILSEFLDYPQHYNITIENGSTLMHASASVGDVICLGKLYAGGSKLDNLTKDGHSPLHTACTYEQIGCIKALLNYGSDPKGEDAEGNTCLHIGAKQNNFDICNIFCDIYDDINLQNRDGWTPLHFCVNNGTDIAMLKLLLHRQGNMFQYSIQYESPFTMACQLGFHKFVHEMVNFAAKKGTPVAHDILENSRCIAKENGHDGISQWLENIKLVRDKIVTPLPDNSVMTPMQSFQCLDESTSLSSNMADMTLSTHENVGAFLNAAKNEDIPYLSASINAGFDVNSFDPTTKMTALHFACLSGSLLLAQFVISKGAYLNVQNIGGLTPLHIACDRQHEHVVLFLLTSGASMLKVSNNGNTPLHMMASRSLYNCVNELLAIVRPNALRCGARNKEGQSALHLAVVGGSVDTCEALLELGCPVDVADYEGQTPLLLACSIDISALVTLLVTRGANVNHSDGHKKTPLYYACMTGNILVAHTLVDTGASVRCVTEGGDTLLHVCSRSGKLLLLKWLVKFGLDLEQKNSYGETPRDCASANNSVNVVAWIDAQ